MPSSVLLSSSWDCLWAIGIPAVYRSVYKLTSPMAHGGRNVKPSCPLTGDRTESKMSFTLQSSLWDQAIIELGLKSHPCLATTSSPSCFPTPSLSVSPGSTWLINHMHMNHYPSVWLWENLTQDKNVILTQPLPSRSSLANWRGWRATPRFLLGKVLYLCGRMP